ncbi:hypothetical protein DICVIV_08814 [Dictyocaulus viviparus]|uniref:Zasp-like motif domain-containing protein n=1 Tax=Dictyocaulus viviparus TaxID=29172 RepID=A0A0D8XKI1_DICVI|nr:hypothetical protein DICVIV_08814 [Dictyocaulus viviparus]
MAHITTAPKPCGTKKRHPSGGQTRIWKPEIIDQRGYGGAQTVERPFRVSLEHSNDININRKTIFPRYFEFSLTSTRPPQGFNSAALPFNTDPRVKHLQYNSPMGLYSNESATEQYVQQTTGIIDNGKLLHHKTQTNRNESSQYRTFIPTEKALVTI